jgi:AraC-like DNA-binding protein
VLQFPPEWVRRTGLPELTAEAPLLARAAAGLEVQGDTRAEVQRLLQRLPGASAMRRVAVLIEVLDTLIEGANDLRALSGQWPALPQMEAGTRSGVRRTDRVLNWIESHLASELRVEDAATVAHVSPAAFARFFRREVGKSFTEYVNDARCGWAALRLIQSTEPVARIAQACGFATLSNFGEQFRRRYGMAPRDFRAGSRGSEQGRRSGANSE